MLLSKIKRNQLAIVHCESTSVNDFKVLETNKQVQRDDSSISEIGLCSSLSESTGRWCILKSFVIISLDFFRAFILALVSNYGGKLYFGITSFFSLVCPNSSSNNWLLDDKTRSRSRSDGFSYALCLIDFAKNCCSSLGISQSPSTGGKSNTALTKWCEKESSFDMNIGM